MKTPRIYSLNNFHTVVLYLTILVLIYLITESLYLLTAFIQFPQPPPLVTTYLISFPTSFFFVCFCFWSIFDLQYYNSSCYTTQLSYITVHFKIITTISHYHVIIQKYYIIIDYIPHTTFHTVTHLFWPVSLYLIFLTYFYPPTTPSPLATTICSLCL